jgi:asparagine synthase (glutamine-hydrolysing)
VEGNRAVCGFVGIRRLDGGDVDEFQLAELAGLLAHRGPDGAGTWTDGHIGLAHRRLAVIDPAGSAQPLASVDDRLHLAFNGEILNYRQLRATLRYPFRTGGDTEVVLALHSEGGPAGIEAARGQFAYALHDRVDGTTWLVRDRLGILPVYYFATARLVAFASEAKALLPLVPGGARVDEGSLDAYLRRRAVPAPATLFRGVRKVPPGHWLRIDRSGAIQLHRYWSIPEREAAASVPEAAADVQVREALEASIEEHLVADVPVGAYLSGGLDSSLITALASRRDDRPLRTFAAGFVGSDCADLSCARLVSEHLGTHHTEVLVAPSDFLDDLGRLTWHRDSPLSEPADLAVHRLAVAAGESVKVVLSGEGADEIFGGYPKHRFARATAWAGLVPRPARRLAADAADGLPRRFRRARIGIRAMAADSHMDRMEAWFAPFTAAERAALLGDVVPPVPMVFPGALDSGADPLRQMLLADAGPWLADNLLERGDRMTMAASVELRPPFLDHRLVELAFRLPPATKVRGGVSKVILRRVAADLLPREVLTRPKDGFRVPLDKWFRSGLGDYACDQLLSPGSFVTSVFERTMVQRLLDRHLRGTQDEDIRIWTLLGLEVWHEQCIAGVPTRVAS